MADNIYATKTGKLVYADAALMILSSLHVALRLVSRRLTKAKLWYDDYAIIIALPLAWMLPILNIIAAHFDFGKHEAVARPDAAEKWYLILYIFENFYAPSIAMVKASILLFYARIFFPKSQTWFRRSLYAMAATVFLWWVICQFFVMFECSPIHYFWDRKPVTGHCQDVQKFFVGQAIPNIITDGILLALPLPMIWQLQLPKAQKCALSGVFMLGSFVTFSSIYRLTLLKKLTQVDITWNYADAAVWSAVEANVAVISACLPMLRPIFKLVAHKVGSLSSYYASSGGTAGSKKSAKRPWHSDTKVNDESAFVRLHEGPAGSAREMNAWVDSGDASDALNEAEMGDVPMGKIRVRHDISQAWRGKFL